MIAKLDLSFPCHRPLTSTTIMHPSTSPLLGEQYFDLPNPNIPRQTLFRDTP